MALSDIKEQVIEKAKEYANKVAENESFIQLMEKFNNLSPNGQKLTVGIIVFVFLYFIYSIPASFVNVSNEKEATFSHHRNLIRGLYRSARNPTIPPDRFQGMSFDQLKTTIDGILANEKILESQKGTYSPANKPLASKFVPGAIRQEGMTFEVKKVNVRQMVKISQMVSSMNANTKLAGVQIEADKEDPHYFNVKYTVSSLSLPMKVSNADKPAKNKKR